MSFAVPKLTNGQLFIGSTGQFPVAASLTAGANITITPGAGTISIAATGGGSPGGSDTQVQFNDGGAFGGDSGLVWDKTNNALVQTSASAAAFESGPNGSTNPVFRLVNSVASAATGLSITGMAAAGGAWLNVLSSGANEPIVIQPKGTGNISLYTAAGGQVLIGTNGTKTLPGIAFLSAATTGIHLNGSSSLIFDSAGSVVFVLGPQTARMRNDVVLGFSSGDPEAVATDTAFTRISAGLIGVGTGAAGSFAGSLKLTDLFTNNAAALIKTNTTLTDNAAAQVGTLTNAPTAGNPAKWIAILDNGTTRYIPTWV